MATRAGPATLPLIKKAFTMAPALPPPRAPKWIAIEEGWASDAGDCARFAVEAICFAARASWQFSFEGQPVEIVDVSEGKGKGRIDGACSGVTFSIDLSARPDGWVECALFLNGRAYLQAFLERPYEEYEFFPSGHSGETLDVEAPGRIGKRLTWVQVRAADWPTLRNTGYLTAEVSDT